MKRNILLLLLCLFSIAGCQKRNSVQEIVIKDQYKMTIPKILTSTNSLHEEASLQFQNPLRELYIVVIDEPKEDIHELINTEEDLSNYPADFEGYTKLIIENMAFRIDIDNVSELKSLKINGHKAYRRNFTSEINQHPVYYEITLIEGRNSYYQIVAWTLASKKKEHLQYMSDMATSFKEL